MNRRRKHTQLLASFGLALAFSTSAYASFLDSDFWCRTYGCAVVHDGNNFDIYDNYNFNSGQQVPVGSQLIPYSSNFGQFNLTGSLDNHVGPSATQGMMLGITQDGSTISNTVIDNGNGYLDAGDSFGGTFALNSNTDIALDGKGTGYSHSFFISSRNTRFSLRARASINNSTQDFANTITLGDIKLNTNVSRRGNDDGFRYGRRATNANILIVNGVNDLGDMQAGPTRIIDFGRFSGIRRRNGNLNDQTIRLDFDYTMPKYDMSMGIGSLNIDMKFDLYREP